MTGRSSAVENINQMHLVRLISMIPGPYYLGWALISTAVLLVSFLILLRFEKSLLYLDLFGIISIIIAMEGLIISWAHDKWDLFQDILLGIVDLPREEIIKLSQKQAAEIFNDTKMIAFALLFILLVHLVGVDYHGLSFGSDISYFAFMSAYYLAVYLEGAGLYILIMTALAVHNIGLLPLRVDALYSDFHSIGMIYSKFTICAAMVYIVWGIFQIVIPLQFSSFQMIAWFSGFAIILFAYFLLPQYSIHKMMISTRKERFEFFSSQLRAAMDGPLEVPTDENVSQLRDMLMVQDKLNKMSEWPFGWRELLYISVIIIIPLIIILLEIALGIAGL